MAMQIMVVMATTVGSTEALAVLQQEMLSSKSLRKGHFAEEISDRKSSSADVIRSASTPSLYGGSEEESHSEASLLFLLGGALFLVLGVVLLLRELAKVIFCGKKSECFTRCQGKETEQVVMPSPEVDTHKEISLYDPPPYHLALHYETPDRSQEHQGTSQCNINLEEEECPPSYQIALIMLRDEGALHTLENEPN